MRVQDEIAGNRMSPLLLLSALKLLLLPLSLKSKGLRYVTHAFLYPTLPLPFLSSRTFLPAFIFFYLSILSFFSSSLFSPYFISHCFPYLYSVTTLLLSLFLLTLFLFTTLFLRHAPSHYVPSPLSFKMFSAASPRALTNVMNTETFAREVRTMPSH